MATKKSASKGARKESLKARGGGPQSGRGEAKKARGGGSQSGRGKAKKQLSSLSSPHRPQRADRQEQD
jgi:hypothetical protein